MTSLLAVFEHLHTKQQRGVIRISGEPKRSSEVITRELALLEKNKPEGLSKHLNVAWFTLPAELAEHSDIRKNEWRLKRYKTYLGEEYNVVVIDLHQGLNLEAIGALSGTIKLGGVLILITPDDTTWLNKPDPEAQRIASFPYKPEDMGHATLLHFMQSLQQADGSWHFELITSSTQLKLITANDTQPRAHAHLCGNDAEGYLTEDQETASEVIKTQLGLAKSITVLTADRGRGKSALLGMALADFVVSSNKPGLKTAVVCSSASSLSVLTKHYENRLESLIQSGVIEKENTSDISHFVRLAPDSEILNLSSTHLNNDPSGNQPCDSFDLVVIDEAASFPLSIIKAASNRTSKLLLATTVHGYEGTGRGFEYKLKPFLKEKAELNRDISYREASMHQPIRWFEGDALEQWTNESLLLNASMSTVTDLNWPLAKAQLDISEYSSQSLLDSGLMREAFALLVQAHYQTTPSDLRAMLDAPDIKTVVVTTQSSCDPNKRLVVATALVSKEGELPDDLGEQIWQGRRRPRGHLAPQSLVAHCGYKAAHRYRYARIIRVAVHPELQGHGLGSQLLRHVYATAQSEGFDFLATSFGISASLLDFWKQNSFVPVRLGLRPETSTGEVSVLMLRAITETDPTKSEHIQHTHSTNEQIPRSALDLRLWNQRFKQALEVELALSLRQHTLPEEVVERLTHGSGDIKLAQSPSLFGSDSSIIDPITKDTDHQAWSQTQHRLDIEAFAFHFRSLDSCVLAFSWTLSQVSKSFSTTDSCQPKQNLLSFVPLLYGKFIQGMPNKKLIDLFNLTGEKALITQMRTEAQQLLTYL